MKPLPENKHVFDFEAVGETTGRDFKGQFTCTCVLSMLEKQLLGIEKTRLQADMSNPTNDLKGIAMILAELRIRIQDAPEWWNQSNGGSTLLDENVVVRLYDKVMEAEGVWRRKLKEQASSSEPKAEEKTAEEKK